MGVACVSRKDSDIVETSLATGGSVAALSLTVILVAKQLFRIGSWREAKFLTRSLCACSLLGSGSALCVVSRLGRQYVPVPSSQSRPHLSTSSAQKTYKESEPHSDSSVWAMTLSGLCSSTQSSSEGSSSGSSSLYLACKSAVRDNIPINFYDRKANEKKIRSIQEMRQLVQEGERPDQLQADGQTPLHYAVQDFWCPAAVLEELLACEDLEVDVYNAQGLTPLCLAVVNGRAQAVALLLEHGADPLALPQQDDDTRLGNTPLHDAARKPDRRLLQIMLQHVDPDQVDALSPSGDTALYKACLCNLPPNALILLEHGADPSCLQSDGNTPLHYAASMHGNDLFDLLVEHCKNVDQQNDAGMTALTFAAYCEDLQKARKLLEKGANCLGIDPSVWEQLPEEMQLLIAEYYSTEPKQED